MSPNIYTQTNALLEGVNRQLKEGEEFKFGGGISLPHSQIKDTALAACLGTIGVPFRDPAPYTSSVDLDDNGNERSHQTTWWLGDMVPMTERDPADDEKKCTTEYLGGAWIKRECFEAENPTHPFVFMRKALDARSRWCARIAAWHAGTAIFPIETPQVAYFHTDKIHAAAVLEGMGFTPLAFNRRTFFLSAMHDGRHAEDVLIEAAQKEGKLPAQWMARVLHNYSHLVKITKASSIIVREPFEDQVLLLTADVDPKVRNRFLKLV